MDSKHRATANGDDLPLPSAFSASMGLDDPPRVVTDSFFNVIKSFELMKQVVGPITESLQEKWNQMLEENKTLQVRVVQLENKIDELETKCIIASSRLQDECSHFADAINKADATVQELRHENNQFRIGEAKFREELWDAQVIITETRDKLNKQERENKWIKESKQKLEAKPKQFEEMEINNDQKTPDPENVIPLQVEWKKIEPKLSWQGTWYRWFFCNASHNCIIPDEKYHKWQRCSSVMEWALTQALVSKISQVTIGDYTVDLVYPESTEESGHHAEAIQINNSTRKKRKLFVGDHKYWETNFEQCGLLPMFILKEIYQGCASQVIRYSNLWNQVQEKLNQCAEEWNPGRLPPYIIKLQGLERVMYKDQVLRFFSRVDTVLTEKGGNKAKIAWMFHGFSDAKLDKLLSTGLKTSMAERHLWGRGNYLTSNVLQCLKSNYTRKSKTHRMNQNDETTFSSTVLLVAALVHDPLLLQRPLLDDGYTTTKPLIIQDTIVPCIIGPTEGNKTYNLCCTDDMDVLITHVVTIKVSRCQKSWRFR